MSNRTCPLCGNTMSSYGKWDIVTGYACDYEYCGYGYDIGYVEGTPPNYYFVPYDSSEIENGTEIFGFYDYMQNVETINKGNIVTRIYKESGRYHFHSEYNDSSYIVYAFVDEYEIQETKDFCNSLDTQDLDRLKENFQFVEDKYEREHGRYYEESIILSTLNKGDITISIEKSSGSYSIHLNLKGEQCYSEWSIDWKDYKEAFSFLNSLDNEDVHLLTKNYEYVRDIEFQDDCPF